MQFTFAEVLGMKCWHAMQGQYSFLITWNGPLDYVCTYKNYVRPNDFPTFFKNEMEHKTKSLSDLAPKKFRQYTLEAAKAECERKYKELLLR